MSSRQFCSWTLSKTNLKQKKFNQSLSVIQYINLISIQFLLLRYLERKQQKGVVLMFSLYTHICGLSFGGKTSFR